MKVDIWMPLYVNDYIADTMHLSTLKHGIYLLLMIHYWKKGDLPKDKESLKAITKIEEENSEVLFSVLREFFTEKNGKYANKRMDEEMKKAKKRSLRASENGKKGGRGNKKEETYSFPIANPTHKLQVNSSHSSSSSSSSSNSQTKKEKEVKHRHGEYSHVLLTDSQLSKLAEDYGKDKLCEMIVSLDEYLELHKNKSYSNHNLTMRKWNAKPEVKSAELFQKKSQKELDIEKYEMYLQSNFPEEAKADFREKIAELKKDTV